MKRKLWDMFFLVLFVGVPTTALVWLSSHLEKGGVVAATAGTSSRGDVFGNFIEFAGIIIGVMLAILAVITSMDERPLIKALKSREDNSYERLVYAMFAPIIIAILLAIMTIVSLSVPSVADDQATIKVATTTTGAVSVTMGLAGSALAQTGYLAFLLVRMLTFRGRPPMLTQADAPTKAVPEGDEEEAPEPTRAPTPKKPQRRRTSHASA